jgi:hypothetical protein
MKKRLALALVSAVLLTACGTAGTPAENAGMAMAETACLIFNDEVNMDSMSAESTTILSKYGFKEASEIDAYLATVQGTAELDTVVSTASKTLTEKCGENLTAKGVDPTELAQAMVSQ